MSNISIDKYVPVKLKPVELLSLCETFSKCETEVLYIIKHGLSPFMLEVRGIKNDSLAFLYTEDLVLCIHNGVYNGLNMLENEFVIELKNGMFMYYFMEYSHRETMKKDDGFKVPLQKDYDLNIYFGHHQYKEAKELIERIHTEQLLVLKRTVNYQNLHVIVSTEEGMRLDAIDLSSTDFNPNIKYNYNKVIVDDSKILISILKKSNKGLYIFHGDPGTGKTSYIKWLSTKVVDKKFIFVPSSFGSYIGSTEFITFINDHKGSVVVIEDAENIVVSREGQNVSGDAVSNILNITDGILSDLLGVQVILTFNTEMKHVDKALTRKGRAKKVIEFKALTMQETEVLLKRLKKNVTQIKSMPLCDILYMADDNYQKTGKKIGF